MKTKEIKELTDAELLRKIEEMRREYFNMGVQSQTGQLKNSAMVRTVRRTVARLRTEVNARKNNRKSVA